VIGSNRVIQSITSHTRGTFEVKDTLIGIVRKSILEGRESYKEVNLYCRQAAILFDNSNYKRRIVISFTSFLALF
jgi:hypothetical protein